jgi:hypothetical protein
MARQMADPRLIFCLSLKTHFASSTWRAASVGRPEGYPPHIGHWPVAQWPTPCQHGTFKSFSPTVPARPPANRSLRVPSL